MRTHARAVVIGGGVVGASTLYHLARKGWSDVMLVERKELTSGSTWHAAGLLPLFNLSYSVGQLHKYSVGLYRTLEQETGQDVGFRQVSNIRLACTPDRLDEYKYYSGGAATLGVETRFLTPDAVKAIWPLCDVAGVIRESDASYDMREESGGLLLGPYEIGAPVCYLDGPAPDSEYELFSGDLDRLMPHIEAAIKRVPAFGEVGIKQIYNGAIPYTP